MARETKEQRELRNAEENRLAEAAALAFKATMPARLMKLQAVASSCGVNTRVFLTEHGPGVEFTRYDYDDRGSNFEENLNYDSNEWDVAHVERSIQAFKEEIDARIRRRGLAEDTWNNRLTLDERTAIKEFIGSLQ